MFRTTHHAGCDAAGCLATSEESWATTAAAARKELEAAGWTFISRGKIGNHHMGWDARCPAHKEG